MHVMNMVYAVVMPVSSIKNVMRVLLVISTLLHVKVNIRITSLSLILGVTFVISFSKFQLVIVIQMDQMVLHVMIMVNAIVKLTLLLVTNVMLVLLVMKTFLHVKK